VVKFLQPNSRIYEKDYGFYPEYLWIVQPAQINKYNIAHKHNEVQISNDFLNGEEEKLWNMLTSLHHNVPKETYSA
jgi:hypothetical protein